MSEGRRDDPLVKIYLFYITDYLRRTVSMNRNVISKTEKSVLLPQSVAEWNTVSVMW